MIIYKTANLENGKVYIGQDSKNDPNYLGSGKYLINAIRKHGKDNFAKEIVDFSESKDDLNEKEIYWIKFYNCKVPNGYNITDGGGGVLGYVFTEEIREKMSESNKGQLRTRETRKKISESLLGEKHPMFGKHRSEEDKKQISISLRGRVLSKEHKKKIGESHRGKSHPQSEETKQKISESLLGEKHRMFGKHHSEETKEKISDSKKGKSNGRLGKHHSEETKEKLREISREKRNI